MSNKNWVLVLLFVLPLFTSAQGFMGRFDVSQVDIINDSTWRLTGAFIDATGSYNAMDADTGCRVIQRGFSSTSKVVFDRYKVVGVLSSDVNELVVNVRSDFNTGVLNSTGMPVTGSFPIAASLSDTSTLVLRTSFYLNGIDFDYDAALDNLNLRQSFGGGGDAAVDSLAWVHNSLRGVTYLRNQTDSVGIGTTTPTTTFSVKGTVSYVPVIVDSVDIDLTGITNLQPEIIYNDVNDCWFDWDHDVDGVQIVGGEEGQFLTIKSINTGRLFLRNNDAQGDTVPAFVMSNGDNITLEYHDNTWYEVGRVDFDAGYGGSGGGGVYQNLSYSQSTGVMSISSGVGDTIHQFAAGVRGLVPDSENDTIKFLRGDGSWAVVPGTQTPTTYYAGKGLDLDETNTFINTAIDSTQLEAGTGIQVTHAAGGVWTITNTVTPNEGTVTSVGIVAGNYIDIEGVSPITSSGTFTITNTAPDQVVSIAGAGISSVTGTYPGTFTVTSTEVDGDITNEVQTLTVTGTATPTITLSQANSVGGGVFTITAGTNVSINNSAGNITISAEGSGSGSVTSVGAEGGTGISVTGSPITSSGTFTITNTDPDQSITNELQNLSYTTASRVLTITSGTGVTLPIFTATDPGLVPLSGGGTANYLRADGNWAAPSGSTTSTTYSFAYGLSATASNVVSVDTAYSSNINNPLSQERARKQYVPVIRTLTVNGTTYDLTTNRTWSVGTVTSVGLTGSTGITVTGSSPITTSGSWGLSVADNSATNEAQTLSVSGTTTPVVSLNAISGVGGGSMTLKGGGATTLSNSAGTITISTPAETTFGTVTGVQAEGGTGINVTGGPITTSGTFLITNTLPEATTITAGTGAITVTGTRPDYIINNTDPDQSVTNEIQFPTYTSSSRVLSLSNTSTTTTLPIFTSTEAGLTPLSGGGEVNFLRADGTWNPPIGSSYYEGYGIDLSGTNTITVDTSGVSSPSSKPWVATYVMNRFTPRARTLTINSTTQTLDTNRTWNVGTVTNVAVVAGTGMLVTGSPITGTGTITVTNDAPDKTVVLSQGTGISITSSYPTFTITNSMPESTVIGQGTGITVTNSGATFTVTNSMPEATTITAGYGIQVTGTRPDYTIINTMPNVGSVTSVGLVSANSGITVAGSPITSSGTFTITHIAPTVNAGSGISVSGAYPGTITITNTAQGQTVTMAGAGMTTITGTYPGTFTITSKLKVYPSFLNCGDSITDTRDGKKYGTVLIGTQCWMSENLNVGTRINGGVSMTNNSLTEKYCYNNSEDNCDIYGGLYQWDEAMQYVTTEGAQGICPSGWHIPTQAEYEEIDGTTPVSLNWLESGLYDELTHDAFEDLNYSGNNWTSVVDLWYYYINGSSHMFYTVGYEVNGLSIRCIQDESATVQTPEVTTLKTISPLTNTVVGDTVILGLPPLTTSGSSLDSAIYYNRTTGLFEIRKNTAISQSLSYTASSRVMTITGGTGAEIPLFSTSTTNAGLVPGSNSAGSTKFLRADGVWEVPPGTTTATTYSNGFGLDLSSNTFSVDTTEVIVFNDTIGTGGTGKIETKYHATTTFEPKLSASDTNYYYRGDKTWQLWVNPDWNQSNSSKKDYIKNKPTLTNGTVTSVGVVGSTGITVSGTSPITSAGTFTLTVADVSASNELQAPAYTSATGVLSLSGVSTTTTIPVFDGTTRGLVPDAAVGATYYLNADGGWSVPAGTTSGTTYTAGYGININGSNVISNTMTISPGSNILVSGTPPAYTISATGLEPTLTKGTLGYSSPITLSDATRQVIGGSTTIGIANAAADGVTKGAASFAANDFESIAGTGNIMIDYENGQKSSSVLPGFLKAADWSAFYMKVEGWGTEGYLPKFSKTGVVSNITNSIVRDDGTNVGIGTAPATYKLSVNGTVGLMSYALIDGSSTNYSYNHHKISTDEWISGFLGGGSGVSWKLYFKNKYNGTFYSLFQVDSTGKVSVSNNKSVVQYSLPNVSGTSGYALASTGLGGTLTWTAISTYTNYWTLNGNNIYNNNNSGNGYVGIGLSTPSAQLQLTKHIRLTTTTDSLTGVIYKGGNRFIHNYGGYNTFLGIKAGNFSTTGNYNVGVGYQTLEALTTGGNNVVIGYAAGNLLETGNDNVHIGYRAGASNKTGQYSICIGKEASVYAGTKNIAIGYRSGYNTGYNTTSNRNVAIGSHSLFNGYSGSGNVAIGDSAGFNTGYSSSSTGNIAIGYRSHGTDSFIGKDNIAIGDSAGINMGALNNTIVIGANVVPTTSNEVILGNSSITKTTLRGVINVAGTQTGTPLATLGIDASNNIVQYSNPTTDDFYSYCTYLIDNTNDSVFYVDLYSLDAVGGVIDYHISYDNGTDVQCITGDVKFSAVRKSSTITSGVSTPSEVQAVSSGTITSSWSTVGDAVNSRLYIRCNINSSLTTGGSIYMFYSVRNNSGNITEINTCM